MAKKLATIKKIEPVFTDKRGEIYDLVEENVGHVGMITFSKGAVRANHYHIQSTQYSYILEGKIELKVRNKQGGETETHILEKSTYVEIPPEVIHVYKALEASVILDMTTLGRKAGGYEADTVRIDEKI